MKNIYLSLISLFLFISCVKSHSKQTITVYSGRSESLMAPIVEQFSKDTGIRVKAHYGKTSEISLKLMEEKEFSPADLFLAQDAGGLGVVANEGLFDPLPTSITTQVDQGFRDQKNRWVGLSGRSRVIAYSKERLNLDELPQSLDELLLPKWKDRIGWPPKNGSFQAFITAMRIHRGDKATEKWLIALKANGAKAYPKNTPIIQAIAGGEVDLGLVNHYYLYRFIAKEGEDYPVANHYPPGDTEATLMNVSGAGILKTSKNKKATLKFIEYMLSDKAQTYFQKETYEYPLAIAYITQMNKELGPNRLPKQTSGIDLSKLSDLKNTVDLLRRVELLN